MFPSEEELRERYSTWSTNSLLSVLHNKGQYTPMAVEIARAELGERKITTLEVDAFLQQQEDLEIEKQIISCFHLTFWEKALSFFVWFTPWVLERAVRLTDSRYAIMAKTRQSRFFAMAGFVSALIDAFLTAYFNLPTRTSVFLLIFLFVIFCWRETKFSYDLSR
jgi:hypothetical protein